jgi:hypothetical protein
VLVTTGWWPPDIEFDLQDLSTVVRIINESRKK